MSCKIIIGHPCKNKKTKCHGVLCSDCPQLIGELKK